LGERQVALALGFATALVLIGQQPSQGNRAGFRPPGPIRVPPERALEAVERMDGGDSVARPSYPSIGTDPSIESNPSIGGPSRAICRHRCL